MALCHLWLFSRLRATPLVVGSLAMVSPGTISSVLSPTGKEVMSDAQEVRSFIGWNFFSLDVLSIWVAWHNSGNVTMFPFPQWWYVTPYYEG